VYASPNTAAAGSACYSQGVIQNFHSYTTSRPSKEPPRLFRRGPVASQEAIKMLGTNGGGFFNANSAHAYENPTPFTNFIECS